MKAQCFPNVFLAHGGEPGDGGMKKAIWGIMSQKACIGDGRYKDTRELHGNRQGKTGAR